MLKVTEHLHTMKTSSGHVQETFTGTNTQMQTLQQDAQEELPYKELTITNQVITDIDKDTVLMLDMFDMMQENITTAIKICNKIIQDHPTPSRTQDQPLLQQQPFLHALL
ncbi:unnamed protein product [Lactuca saligna]|uniref:Uncharacterized protein n=1 Tax=Lactuca saligna TaxID=75948 RepID=A0AA35Y9H7_LACSI|nr:unnamed protein product [Lactuca saligna]